MVGVVTKSNFLLEHRAGTKHKNGVGLATVQKVLCVNALRQRWWLPTSGVESRAAAGHPITLVPMVSTAKLEQLQQITRFATSVS